VSVNHEAKAERCSMGETTPKRRLESHILERELLPAIQKYGSLLVKEPKKRNEMNLEEQTEYCVLG